MPDGVIVLGGLFVTYALMVMAVAIGMGIRKLRDRGGPRWHSVK